MSYNDYFYTEMQVQFFIATSAEMNNIMLSCDKRFGTKMRQGWKRIKAAFLTVKEPTDDEPAKTPRQIWNAWYREKTKKPEQGKRHGHKDIDWFGNSIKDFWRVFMETLVRFALIVEIPKKIKWSDCPVRGICNRHPMSPDELNTARTQYPAFHKETTKYPKNFKKHCCCRVHKQTVHSGECRIYEEVQRIREHLFLKSKHIECYHYMECMMLSVASFILTKFIIIIIYNIDK